jgi:hypothetical protein
MKQKDIDEIILDQTSLEQYTDIHHPDFDLHQSLLAVQISPNLFTSEQIKYLQELQFKSSPHHQ